jgi:predicted metalloprotease with PDZ domain
LLLAVVVSMAVLAPVRLPAQALAPITYTVRIPAPESHFIEVDAVFPTAGRPSIELMMPIWTPGYYRVEDYAAQISDLFAKTTDGKTLAVEKTDKNHWRLDTGGAATAQLSYRVFCNQRSVTTNEVTASYGVLNGAPTFITLAEPARRPHDVQIELPQGWTRAMTGLADAPGGKPNRFRAADFETLVDSPILLGGLGVHEFVVSGKRHYVVSVGNTEGWDGDRATRDLQTFVEESQRFWGFLPYEKYLFLLMFRQGGGGLEHKNSNLSTVVARSSPERKRWQSLGLEAHEYFHLFNVKRLRPVELGPFDFDEQPTTGSLWMAEGVTSYYSGLLMTRSGLQTSDEYLAALSSLIGNLQESPGRLLQSVERSSLEVWGNSNSGVNPNASTVSYYNKGNVIGLLLDAKIRRATNGRKSFDDVMRQAYQRYSGERGYTPDELRLVAEGVAGTDLRDWFRTTVSSTEELDYSDLLEVYGLQFVASEKPPGNWKLEVRPDRTDAQKRRMDEWLAPSRAR